MTRDPKWVSAYRRRPQARPATYHKVHVDLAEEASRRDQFLETLPEQIEAELELEFVVEMGS